MAPYKLEDNIREKLEAREITPSTNAWEKLETKLDAAQPKKKTVLWYYMAASFVGLLILGSIFFKGNNEIVKNEIVTETVEQETLESQQEVIPNDSEVEKIVSTENISEKVETSNSKEKEKQKVNSNPIKSLPQKKSIIDKKIEKTEMVAKVENEEKQQLVESASQKTKNSSSSRVSPEALAEAQALAKGEDKLFNTKVNEVVASVKKLQENNTEISVTELEALLNNARREIQTQRILNSPKVDAMALLQDVEWELEKSFRDKVFDALGDGFNKIRTAVIERND